MVPVTSDAQAELIEISFFKIVHHIHQSNQLRQYRYLCFALLKTAAAVPHEVCLVFYTLLGQEKR